MSKSTIGPSHEYSAGKNCPKPSAHRIGPRLNFTSILLLFTLLSTAALLATSACTTSPAVQTYQDDFAVGASASLVVDGTAGWIHVETAPGNQVHVEATVRDFTRMDYEATTNGDIVTVTAKRKGSFLSPGFQGRADILVTVPAATSLTLETSDGDIAVTGTTRGGVLKTSNGNIVLENVKGDFQGDTSNGDIEINTMEGSGLLRTSNGKVDIENAKGEFNASSSNGPIFFSGEMIPGGSNRLTTSNGEVTVQLQGTPSIDLDASTSDGKVSSDLAILATETETNHLVGKIGAGEADLYIHTSNGNVIIK
jgi:hypothetical protein